jgi:type VI secretion system protein VasD
MTKSRSKPPLDSAALALLVALAACSSPPAPPPEGSLHFELIAAAEVNPDFNGRPSPISVKLYQLADAETVRSADFFQIADEKIFAPDKPQKVELILRPGEHRSLDQPLAPNAKYVAAVAAFQNVDKANWRAVKPLKQHADNRFLVTLKGVDVSLSEAEAAPGAQSSAGATP